MFEFIRKFFSSEPQWSDPKAQRWANILQSRARFTGQLPEPSIIAQMGMGPDDRFWKQDNRVPRKGSAVNFDVPLSWFVNGTEDANLATLTGTNDFGKPVKSFPIKATAPRIYFDLVQRIFDVPFDREEVPTKLMVEVCCGFLIHRILPRRAELEVHEETDFAKLRLRRITWDKDLGAWYCILVSE